MKNESFSSRITPLKVGVLDGNMNKRSDLEARLDLWKSLRNNLNSFRVRDSVA